MLWLLNVAFNRGAFRGKSNWRGSTNLPDFTTAISNTSRAVNTGILLTRSGKEIARGKPVGLFVNPAWREEVSKVAHLLDIIIKTVDNKTDKRSSPPTYNLTQDDYDDMDKKRDAMIIALNQIWRTVGIPELPIPTQEYEQE